MQPNYVSANGLIAGTRNFGDTAILYIQEWGPRILAAAVILLIGYLVAQAVKWGVAALVNKTPLARHAHRHTWVPEAAGRQPKSVGAQVGDAAFWIVILIALVLAAQPLGLAAATSPIGGMLNGFGAAIPRIIGAGLIFFVGYIVASVAKKAIEAVLTAARTEQNGGACRHGQGRPDHPAPHGRRHRVRAHHRTGCDRRARSAQHPRHLRSGDGDAADHPRQHSARHRCRHHPGAGLCHRPLRLAAADAIPQQHRVRSDHRRIRHLPLRVYLSRTRRPGHIGRRACHARAGAVQNCSATPCSQPSSSSG